MTASTTYRISFEQKACTRCDGSKKHSFNGSHSRCYQCKGTGMQITGRGKRARTAFEEAINASGAAVEVTALEPGMRILSKACGNSVYAERQVWRTVAQVIVHEPQTRVHGGRGEDGALVDVQVTTVDITFEDDTVWWAHTSGDAAYWNKGPAQTTYTRTHFHLMSDAAQEIRREVMQDIASRFAGAELISE